MQLNNKANKFLFLGCLALILWQLAGYTNRSSTLQGSWNFLTRVTKVWDRQASDSSVTIEGVPSKNRTLPLVMEGGDPYIRALMRTITASEANVTRPYNVIYGGQYTEDLTAHPQVCVPIVTGPNIGKCSTAAGRYQMLDITWDQQARRYHPNPAGFWRWKSYSFEAQYQDAVVHDWLSDSNAWGTNIPQLLRQGEITEVLKLLSSTWTSLGYGIETNSMSRYLPEIYQNMLQEELS